MCSGGGNACFRSFRALPLPPAVRTFDGQVFRILILALQTKPPEILGEVRYSWNAFTPVSVTAPNPPLFLLCALDAAGVSG